MFTGGVAGGLYPPAGSVRRKARRVLRLCKRGGSGIKIGVFLPGVFLPVFMERGRA